MPVAPDPHSARVVLFISPHLDDAVLSVGGLIAERTDAGRECIVATIFAGDGEPPFSSVARSFHRECGLSDDNPASERRGEDRRALASLGARAIQCHLPEALYRRDDRGMLYTRPRSQFGPRHPSDARTLDAVVSLITSLLQEIDDPVVLAPLGVGGHVDHELVRDAAIVACETAHVPLLGWIDQPYEILTREVADSSPIDDPHMVSALDAAAQYSTQIPMLFPSAVQGDRWREIVGEVISGTWGPIPSDR